MQTKYSRLHEYERTLYSRIDKDAEEAINHEVEQIRSAQQ